MAQAGTSDAEIRRMLGERYSRDSEVSLWFGRYRKKPADRTDLTV
jgi:hypothetical protein